MAFQISYCLKIPFDFDDMEYYEFLWLYERLAKEIEKENEEVQNKNGSINLHQ